MRHRLGQSVLATILLAAPALLAALPGAAAAEAAGVQISAPSWFSPNGDGVKDKARVTVRLDRPMDVRLQIEPADALSVERRVDLGRLSSGTHVWTWNGRDRSGRTVPDQGYRVTAYATDSAGSASATDLVQVDTVFEPELTAPTYGAEPGAPAHVYPRTTVVTDVLPLRALVHESAVADLRVVVRDARGRVVRRADVARPLPSTDGRTYAHGRTVGWTARRGGEPLPRGRYTAVLSGSDRAGNAGRAPRVRIWVSDDKLVWREATETVTPAATDFGPCDWTTANGCGEVPECGVVVPSTLFDGGLSYRARACDPPRPYADIASSAHLLEVPEATGVRGLAAVRVSFTGAPTTPGETDTGTLLVWGDGPRADASVVGTSGRSAWVDDPSWGEGKADDGYLPQRDPAAAWSFVTEGTDSVDVATFTVDVRYLALAG